MGCTKAALKEEMDIAEFAEHKVDYEMMPWGDDWVQTDMLLTAQVGKPKHLRDYIPRRRIPLTAQDQETLVAKLKAAFGIVDEVP